MPAKRKYGPPVAPETRWGPMPDEEVPPAGEVMAKGAAAYRRGRQQDNNPYHRIRQSALHSLWDLGWTQAAKEANYE